MAKTKDEFQAAVIGYMDGGIMIKQYYPITVSNSPIVAVNTNCVQGLVTKFEIAIPDLELSVDLVELADKVYDLRQYILMMFDDEEIMIESKRRAE